jgi:hypothetical protein
MQHGMKMDIATMVTAGGVAAYVAIATSYVALDLGTSLHFAEMPTRSTR